MTHNEIAPHEVTSVYASFLVPDYYLGSDANEVLAVPVYAYITYKEAYEAAKEEFHSTTGYFSEVAGSGTLVEDALHNLFARMLFESPDEPSDLTEYIDEDIDSGDTVFMYIGLYAESDLN